MSEKVFQFLPVLCSVSGQKGLFIIDLSPQGAATKAGVQSNDRLIEINGENVENDTHEGVVEKVLKTSHFQSSPIPKSLANFVPWLNVPIICFVYY